MARKGNHQKNGLDRHGLNHKKGVSGGVLPGMKGHAKGDQVQVFPGEELPNCSQPNGLSQNANESISLGNKNNREQKSEKLSRKEKQGMVAKHDLEEPLSFGSNVGYGSQNTEAPRREENGTSPRSNEGQQRRSRLSCLLNRLHIKSVVDKVELADNAVVRRLRLSVSSMFAVVTEWLVRQKPLFVSLTTCIYKAREQFRMKIEQAYPILLKWIIHFGNVMLFLSVLWLKCALRGMDSFVRMGTTSFFSVVWCSIFSVISMIGIIKFSFVLDWHLC